MAVGAKGPRFLQLKESLCSLPALFPPSYSVPSGSSTRPSRAQPRTAAIDAQVSGRAFIPGLHLFLTRAEASGGEGRATHARGSPSWTCRQEGEQASGLGLGAGAAATARPWLSRAGGNPLQQLKMMQGAATSQLLSGASAPAARVGSDWQAARPLQAPRFASAQRQPAALQVCRASASPGSCWRAGLTPARLPAAGCVWAPRRRAVGLAAPVQVPEPEPAAGCAAVVAGRGGAEKRACVHELASSRLLTAWPTPACSRPSRLTCCLSTLPPRPCSRQAAAAPKQQRGWGRARRRACSPPR